MFFIFDIVFMLTSIFFHFVALYITYMVTIPFWPTTIEFQLLFIIITYFLFLHVFPLLIGIFRFFFQPRLIPGEYPIGINSGYGSYVLNSLLYGVFISSPFHKQSFFIMYLRWAFYRLFGMKLPYSSIVSVEADIRQPELIEVGKNSIIGAGCVIICHYSPTAHTHIQQKVKIGNKSVIGGYTVLAPDFEIGNSSVIGAKCSVYPGVKVGNKVKIGAECSIFFGVTIPDDVKIKSHSLIDKHCNIRSGETWGGNPAQKISDLKE